MGYLCRNRLFKKNRYSKIFKNILKKYPISPIFALTGIYRTLQNNWVKRKVIFYQRLCLKNYLKVKKC